MLPSWKKFKLFGEVYGLVGRNSLSIEVCLFCKERLPVGERVVYLTYLAPMMVHYSCAEKLRKQRAWRKFFLQQIADIVDTLADALNSGGIDCRFLAEEAELAYRKAVRLLGKLYFYGRGGKFSIDEFGKFLYDFSKLRPFLNSALQRLGDKDRRELIREAYLSGAQWYPYAASYLSFASYYATLRKKRRSKDCEVG